MPELGEEIRQVEEIRRAMDERSRRDGSVDGLWQRVRRTLAPASAERRARAWRRVSAWAVVTVAAALVAGVGLNTAGVLPWGRAPASRAPGGTADGPVNSGLQSTGTTQGGLAIIIPTLSGTVYSIADGSLHLTDTALSRPHDYNGGSRPGSDLPLPPGRWLTATHWQSDGDSLDLFLGERVVYFITSKVIAPEPVPEPAPGTTAGQIEATEPGVSATAPGLRFFDGVVTAVTGDSVTFMRYPGQSVQPVDWTTAQGEITLRIAPYSYRGMTKEEQPKVGDRAIVGWFGDDTDRIMWQYAKVGP